jgi:uncharacterized protein YukE
MGGFNQQTVNSYGGVAWAKQVAESMDPGAIDSQIQGYHSAVSTLATVQTTLQNVKNNLASSWSGDAADQAQQSFQNSVAHSQKVQDAITQGIIPPLQSAKAAQQEYINSMSSVPDEQTVPSNSWVDDVESFFGSQTPAQKAETHNTAARTQAADALNTLSSSYDSSASKLSAVGGSEGDVDPGTSSAFSLGPVASSSGDGAASSYSESVNGGGSTSKAGYVPSSSTGSVNSVSDPRTTLAGNSNTSTFTPVPTPIWTTNPSPKTSATPEPDSVWGNPDPLEDNTGNGSYNKGGLITDDPDEGASGGLSDGLGDENIGRGGGGSSSGVFDETGLGDGELTGGTGSGLRGGMSSSDGTSLVGDSEGAAGGAVGSETSETGMGGGMGRGMGGTESGEEDLGSSRYSRGRFFDEEDDASGLSPVRSAYEGATDADGNKVNMMGPGRRGTQEDDEEDERQKRPSYLKEDEFWKNAQRIVPPVIQ